MGQDMDKMGQSRGMRGQLSAAIYTRSDVVTVTVGPRNDRFHVHRDLLCAKSRFFQACLQGGGGGGFLEASTNHVNLGEEESSQPFAHFVHWLYHDTFPAIELFGGVTVEGGGTKSMSTLMSGPVHSARCAALYKLADKLMATACKNELCSAIRRHWRDLAQLQSYELGSQAKLPPSPLGQHLLAIEPYRLQDTPFYRLFIQCAVYTIFRNPEPYDSTGTAGTHAAELDGIWDVAEIVGAVLRETIAYQARRYDDPRRERGCRYHDHSDGSGGTCRDLESD